MLYVMLMDFNQNPHPTETQRSLSLQTYSASNQDEQKFVCEIMIRSQLYGTMPTAAYETHMFHSILRTLEKLKQF